MSEYWKSTERYWCKHCACYVRDTKIERKNHEATARHQGALKRSLRDLHRNHEREERDKERAQREIARLNGVVPGSSASASTSQSHIKYQPPPTTAGSSEANLKKQREQLAELGVAIPSDFRPEMAMPGEWTVTNTRIIDDKPPDEETKIKAKATGVRKREVTEEEKEEEDAIQGLFKKPRRWGRDSKVVQQEDDAELEALLNGDVLPIKAPREEVGSGDIGDSGDDTKHAVKKESAKEIKEETEEGPVKSEPHSPIQGVPASVKDEGEANTPVKTEDGDTSAPAIVFKKRKPKAGIRQK